jgi:pimeloyl-ACP methyl ester carboxylesterase
MSAIMLDGSIVHYEALGRGRPIVFLHDWVGSWRYWIAAMQVASTSFRAYALDLFGFGDTAHETVKYPLEQQASLLNQFLSEMGIGKIAIVGHGLGALVGFQFIQQYPKSVDRIMAVACPQNAEGVNARMKTASISELVDWLSNRSPEAVTALADAPKADPKAITSSLSSMPADGVLSMREAVVPSLFVYGQNDPAITLPVEDSQNPYSLAHQIVLDNIGHFPMIEDQLKFNRLMTDFMALDSGASPKELQMKEEWKRRVR